MKNNTLTLANRAMGLIFRDRGQRVCSNLEMVLLSLCLCSGKDWQIHKGKNTNIFLGVKCCHGSLEECHLLPLQFMIHMDNISRHSLDLKSVRFEDFTMD